MSILNLNKELAGNSYPGRGIVLGVTPDGENVAMAYFIMGRSANSRNRVFIEKENDVFTQAADPSKMEDPSLIIYAPVRVNGKNTVVTNGDQTDTINDFLTAGKTFGEALQTREFEPDAPNYTPRISGMVTTENNLCQYTLSILKSCFNNGGSCQRFFYEYKQPLAGQGHFIHTYNCDGDPIPSFVGEPKMVEMNNDIEQFTNDIWNGLNHDNKVSLFVRFQSIKTGKITQKIINKYSLVD